MHCSRYTGVFFLIGPSICGPTTLMVRLVPPTAVTVPVRVPSIETVAAGGPVRVPPASIAMSLTDVADGSAMTVAAPVGPALIAVSAWNTQGGLVAVPTGFPTGTIRLMRSGPRSG